MYLNRKLTFAGQSQESRSDFPLWDRSSRRRLLLTRSIGINQRSPMEPTEIQKPVQIAVESSRRQLPSLCVTINKSSFPPEVVCCNHCTVQGPKARLDAHWANIWYSLPSPSLTWYLSRLDIDENSYVQAMWSSKLLFYLWKSTKQYTCDKLKMWEERRKTKKDQTHGKGLFMLYADYYNFNFNLLPYRESNGLLP